MKPFLLLLILIQFPLFSFAQKKQIDNSVISKWPIISNERISNDGKYVCYTISSLISGNKIYVQSVDRKWIKEFIAESANPLFTADNKHLVFRSSKDTLIILSLQNQRVTKIGDVISFKVAYTRNNQWLAYQQKSLTVRLLALDSSNQQGQSFFGVDNYIFNTRGNALLIASIFSTAHNPRHLLSWINLNTNKSDTIYNGAAIRGFVFNESGAKMAFLENDLKSNGQSIIKIRYYQVGMDSAKVLVESSTPGMAGFFVSDSDMSFTSDGDKLFFYLARPGITIMADSVGKNAKVDIWNYKDDFLQPETYYTKTFLSVIKLVDSPKVIRLQMDWDNFQQFDENRNSNYVTFVSDIIGNSEEHKWRITARPNLYLVSISDGSRRLLASRCILGADPAFSVGGKYVTWYDKSIQQWKSYNIEKRETKNISKGIGVSLSAKKDIPDFSDAEGIAGWLKNDEWVLIYDRYDIWKIDPSGIKEAVNVTGGYGRKTNTTLRYFDFRKRHFEGFNTNVLLPISANDTLILTAVNHYNKYNGFFNLILGKRNRLEKLKMGPDIYYYSSSQSSIAGHSIPFFPLKASQANAYIVRPMNVSSYPNLNFTTNFKDFVPITNLAPQASYNWMNSELIHWKLLNGRQMEGILYKPENFDPNKKYPVIFYYYEKNSDALNLFIHPELSNGTLNIPWYVSNGYLVCVPDIVFYKKGYPGECVKQAVVSAANYLSKFHWVRFNKMGIQGFSYGGWETNYIVAHSHIFAAAAPGEAASNVTSAYGHSVGGRSGGWYWEERQGRIGFSLWERPDLYIENSPIFKANQVTTPLLILQNNDDFVVPSHQGTEWFNDLSRLGKKVWLLSYDNEGHGLLKDIDQLDYTIRLEQFFDYYLKDKPAPTWMTKGVHGTRKGIDTGLELDLESGIIP